MTDISCSDEAHFYLNGTVNRENACYWSSEKPNLYLEKPLNGEQVTVWAVLSSKGVTGPSFFENKMVTVTTIHYLEVLFKNPSHFIKKKREA